MKSSSRTAPPTKFRDGMHLISTDPIHYDVVVNDTNLFIDITYQVSTSDQCARIAFNRPEVLHAFRPRTINEVRRALEMAQDDTRVGVILLSSEIIEERTPAFCAG
eukprot:12477342-Ditylum_brightwellii.AAC.1